MKPAGIFLTGVIVVLSFHSSAAQSQGVSAQTVGPEAEEFFEKQVRPVLSKNCFPCHGEKVQMAGLRLDSLAGILKGTDAGHTVLTPGEPEKSGLIGVLGYEGSIKMPPSGKLPAQNIEALSEWIRMGAPWPQTRNDVSPSQVSPAEWAKKHWAFQPVQRPAIPRVKDKAWVRSPIDAFILAKLEEKGLRPSKPADRRTLIRRVYFDLIGLPPSYEAVAAFVSDKSPHAFAKVVDQLLTSPRYGERWGRYWLDVARYSDTKGYTYQEEPRYHYAYTYRDYVVRAFNQDLPYDQFLTQQIAAEQIPLESDKASLAAMGFLTLGRRFLNVVPDIVDDRLDVIFRGTQALTIGCARCHDHKYDPIPQKDYYSLYGVFANSTEPKELPLIAVSGKAEAYLAYEKELRAQEAEVQRFLEGRQGEIAASLREKIPDYLLAVWEAEQNGTNIDTVVKTRRLVPQVFRRWQSFLGETRIAPHTVFAPWNAFASLSRKEFAAKAPDVAAAAAAGRLPSGPNEMVYIVNPMVARSFAGGPPATLEEVAQRYGSLLLEIDRRWREDQDARSKETYYKKDEKDEGEKAPTGLKDPDEEQLRLVIYGQKSPVMVPLYTIEELFDVADRQRLQELRDRVRELKMAAPPEPSRAMVLLDAAEIKPAHVFLRGDAKQQGEEVPRQFLEVLSGSDRKPFLTGSGRLELAQAIAGDSNPLTARVMANRIWLWHFGSGLVETPSDFGLRGEPPSHPELLDYLAWRFMEEGWSIKEMHRLLLSSNVYQQSGDTGLHPSFGKAKTYPPISPLWQGGEKGGVGSISKVNPQTLDPENTLLWKMNRRKLDFEAMRDSLLAVSGNLDLAAGGPPGDLTAVPFSQRRSVYGFVDRQNLAAIFRTFDFANPETHSPQRFTTTVPQQALFLMNTPVVAELARQVVRHSGIANKFSPLRKGAQGDLQWTPTQAIQRLYRQIYARSATPEEIQLGLRFLKSVNPEGIAADGRDPSAWRYGFGELDHAAGSVVRFQTMDQFAGDGWLGGPALHEPKIGRATLNAVGGRPGNDPQHVAIRRWIAPRDGLITINSTVGQISYEAAGDGIQAYIVSSRSGVLGKWKVRNEAVEAIVPEVKVKQGDTIDFVVECQVDAYDDNFTWAPVIRYQLAQEQTTAAVAEWNASRDFSGPSVQLPVPLNVWQSYAQVLLLANEFVFVD